MRLPSPLIALALFAALACASLPGCTPEPRVLPQASAGEPARAKAGETAGEAASEKVAEKPPARAWAEPIERPGLPNLHRVTPLLYRGAQPTSEGFLALRDLGVKSVVSLRGFHSDDIPVDAGLKYERISFKTWHPEDEDVVRFLKLVSDPTRQPVFVHCQWGADRTGMMCAIARIAFEGWSKDQAIAEMTQGGFGFHKEWQNLIGYVRELDVEKLAREAGVKR